MPRYRLKDLLILPAYLSLSRVVLAACFPFVVEQPWVALTVLALAAISDVLDGWVARRQGLTTATGAVLDPITDKLFVLTVAVTLVISGHLSLAAVLLLSTREIGELPLVVWLLSSPRARAARREQETANLPGKLATVLQFLTVGWALLQKPRLELWVAATAIAGALAALSYWRRSLRTLRATVAGS